MIIVEDLSGRVLGGAMTGRGPKAEAILKVGET